MESRFDRSHTGWAGERSKKRRFLGGKRGLKLPDQPIVDAFGVVEVNAGQVADGHAFFKVFKANRALFRSLFFFCPLCDLRKFRF